MNLDLRFNNRHIWSEENIMLDKIKKTKINQKYLINEGQNRDMRINLEVLMHRAAIWRSLCGSFYIGSNLLMEFLTLVLIIWIPTYHNDLW